MNTRLIQKIEALGSPKITVVGDLILDTYVHGEANRISPEAPIQVLDVREEHSALGGAANVAANLEKLGAQVELCGVLGQDENGRLLLAMLKESGIGAGAVLFDDMRPTITKTRVVAHNQQLVRIDRETRHALDRESENRLFDRLAGLLDRSDIIVLSDYAKGVLTPSLIEKIVKKARAGVLVDPKGRDFVRYRGSRLLTPNRREAEEATGLTLRGREDLRKAARILFETVGLAEVVITLGGEGIFYATSRGDENIVPALARSVYDVTGAGDTVIAVLALCLASGMELDDAVRMANAAAGIVVGKLGVATPSREELKDFFGGGSTRYLDKIISRERAKGIAKRLEGRGEKLVFTNGCFDLIHGGHVRYLREAKALGDRLMVGVNGDGSVGALKGPRRPILGIEERMEILASLQVVDYVVSFSEETPLALIEEVTPHILVKGEDWREKGVVGREWVEAHGGRVELIPLTQGRSTTGVIEKILSRYAEGSP